MGGQTDESEENCSVTATPGRFSNGTLVASYVYNAEGQRTRKVTQQATTIYHYDINGNLISETTSSGIAQRDYIYTDNTPIAQIDIGTREDLTYLHTDHLGTPRIGTDANRTVVWSWRSFGFGSGDPNSDPDLDNVNTVVNLRMPGMYADGESGLYYNWFRHYDPRLGRYITTDPVGPAGGMNTYRYGRANPLRYTDPTGLDTTMTCRPVKLFGDLGLSEPVHCSVIVWHWETDCNGKRKKVIDAQYSLPGGGTGPTGDPNNPTFQGDRNAFNNPGGPNTNYPIPPPPGMSQGDFDRAVINSGSNYSQGTYMPPGYGPNSNTAANNIIRNAGGTPPDVPGAWGQNYTPSPPVDPNLVPGIPW